MWNCIDPIGCINILFWAIFLIAIHPKWIQAKRKAKFEKATMSWALEAITNLAIGIILLLIEKYVFM